MTIKFPSACGWLLPVLLLASCAKDAPPKAYPVLPPVATVAVAPKVNAIQSGLDRAGDSSVALKAANAVIVKQLDSARQQAAEVSRQAAKFAQAGMASAADLIKQAAANATLADQVGRLQDEADKTTVLLDEQSKALIEARAALTTAQSAAAVGDAAQSNLSAQVTALNGQFQQVSTQRDAARSAAATAAANLKTEKAWSFKLLLAVIALVLAILGWIALKILIFCGKLSWKLP